MGHSVSDGILCALQAGEVVRAENGPMGHGDLYRMRQRKIAEARETKAHGRASLGKRTDPEEFASESM